MSLRIGVSSCHSLSFSCFTSISRSLGTRQLNIMLVENLICASFCLNLSSNDVVLILSINSTSHFVSISENKTLKALSQINPREYHKTCTRVEKREAVQCLDINHLAA